MLAAMSRTVSTVAVPVIIAGAANPKFAPHLPRIRLRTSGSKRHQNHRVCWCPFDSEVRIGRAARLGELRNRDTSCRNRRALFLIRIGADIGPELSDLRVT